MGHHSRLWNLVRFCPTFLAAVGCGPLAASEAGGGDASVVYVDRERDDAGNLTSVLVHVVGLAGDGLALTVDGLQEVQVPGNGKWRVPLTTPKREVALSVLAQPSEPSQSCTLEQLDETIFSVNCHDQRWQVSGVIDGLVGEGLRLAIYDEGDDDDVDQNGSAHNIISLEQAGAFAFSRPLEDKVTYHVEVLEQPEHPQQDCTVENSDGTATADITNIHVSCVTKTFALRTVVVGLQGSGLVIDTEIGPIPLEPGVTVYNERFPDGYVFHGEISHQPTGPNQTCFMQNGTGVIDGADVDVMVICDARGALRISEVGSCPGSSSGCWFEIVNVGESLEDLGFYRMRSSALSSKAFIPSREFTLPDVSIPSFARVIVQGKVAGALPDGSSVFHVADGDAVPWWGTDGFVELLNPAGATATFLRWGSSTMVPTTGGVYGGGSAPALPRGTAGYGYSLQHPNGPDVGLPTGDLFKLWAFPTPGAPNDVNDSADVDSDGIPDSGEAPGGTYAGLSFYAMGARIGQQDVFVEIDHMTGGDPATLPRKEALDKVVATFKRRNIHVHFDVGNLFSPGIDPANYNLGGGNEVPFATAVGLAPSDAAIKNLYEIKAANMAANRRVIFYYQLFAWSQQKDGSGGSSGVGEVPGNDSIITLGGFGLSASTAAQRNLVTNYQAASIMHELGHNFSLRHGGGDSINRKPNYVSVMNYLYSPFGLPSIGEAEGDRYDFYKRCSLASVTQLTNAPSGDPSKFSIDFSDGSSESVDENAVQEATGLGRKNSKPVDFNCNSRAETTSYARDLNADGALDMLADNDDWHSLDFIFRRYAAGADNGPSLRPDLERFDVLSADATYNTDTPCPAPQLPAPEELH